MKLRKMERRILLVAFALSFALIVGCGGDRNDSTISTTNPDPNAFTPKGTVSGVLRDAVTNEALVGAKVQIMDKVATTDSSGIFTITNVPALQGTGNEGYDDNAAYTVVIDMSAVNTTITAFNADTTHTVKKAFYPSMAYANVMVYYTSLGESSDLASGATNSTNHDTPVDGFVANITPFIGKLDANVKMQVVNTSLVPQSGATVYLFNFNGTQPVQPDTSTGTTGGGSTGAVDSGTPGKLIDTQTTDANGYVTFQKIEAKRSYAVKAIAGAGATQGWWEAATSAPPFAVPVAAAASPLTAPADNLTDIYGLNQAGSASASPDITMVGAYYSVPLVVRTVDGLAPFVTGVVPANLSDIAIPTTTPTLDVVFTFSEPIRSTPYANALTRDTSVNGGLYADVAINYLGPKAGNIPHTLAWTDTTHLTISIPVASMTPASRYSVSILNACNGSGTLGTAGRLTDANSNNFIAFTNTATNFTTAGGFNVAAPVIAKDVISPYTVNWTPVTNAFGYRVYVEAVAGTGFFPVTVYNGGGTGGDGLPLAANLTTLVVSSPTTFSLTLLRSGIPPAFANLDKFVIGTNASGRYNVMANGFAGGKSYNVYVVALSSNGSESEKSNIVAVSETKPAAPTGLARRGTTRIIDWTAVAGATQYTIWVETLVNGAALAGYVPVATSIDPTYDLAGVPATGTIGQPGYVPTTLPFAGTGATVNGYALGAKLSYNVAVTTTSPTNTLTSDLSTAVLIDDKQSLQLAQPGTGAIGTLVGAAPNSGGIAGGTLAPLAAQSSVGGWHGVSVNQAAAFTMTATIPVPEQLTYSSAIASGNWTVVMKSAGDFALGKPAAAAPVTAVTDTLPTISNITYDRAGGNVAFTLSYAAPGTNAQAWYGAAGSVLLQTSVTDLNGNVVSNRDNGSGAGIASGVNIN